MTNRTKNKVQVTFFHPETMNEELGYFIEYVGPFKAKIKQGRSVFIVDIDDFQLVD